MFGNGTIYHPMQVRGLRSNVLVIKVFSKKKLNTPIDLGISNQTCFTADDVMSGRDCRYLPILVKTSTNLTLART